MDTRTAGVPEVKKYDKESSTMYLRDGVVFALFFGIVNAETAEALALSLDIFLGMLPTGALRWASVGATSEEWKPVTKTTFDRCKAQVAYSAMQARKLTAFELRDGDKGGDAPQYGIALFANSAFEGKPKKKNLLQMYFPTAVLREDQIERFVTDIQFIAARIPFVSGYCSPSLVFAENLASKGLDAARRIGVRHHGFDVQYNQLSRVQIGNQVRGAKWINFLSPAIVAELGGAPKLRKLLPKPVSVKETSNGVVIRTSELPEIGDTNRQLRTPLLTQVALVLEPVTLFGERVLLNYEFADGDPKVLSTWERRFFE